MTAQPFRYTTDITRLHDGRILRFQPSRDDAPLSWSDVVCRWQNEPEFRDFFVSLLVEAPFPAYFFETPPVTAATADEPFEFVLVDSQALVGVRSDQHAFSDHFALAQTDESVIEFANLRGDATLIVPYPGESLSAFSHLAEFARHAPKEQQHRFWERVGAALERRLATQRVWLSTSGLGIYWLHMRLDSSPKYYTYAPYRGGF